MTLGRFTNPSASDIGAGLVPVPPPIRKSDVTAIRNNYGIAADFTPKGQSDTSLYAHSVQFVLDWWKKNNPANAASGQPPAGGGNPPAGSSGGGKPPAGLGATMPDTAMSTSTGPVNILPHILTQQEQQAMALGTARGAVTAAKATGITTTPTPQSYPNLTSNISGTVSQATAQSILTQMGLRGATPPASALTSTTALRAWAQQQLAARALAASRGAATATKAGV